jgi:hypothetical protein
LKQSLTTRENSPTSIFYKLELDNQPDEVSMTLDYKELKKEFYRKQKELDKRYKGIPGNDEEDLEKTDKEYKKQLYWEYLMSKKVKNYS